MCYTGKCPYEDSYGISPDDTYPFDDPPDDAFCVEMDEELSADGEVC